jgi:hypothetical protein
MRHRSDQHTPRAAPELDHMGPGAVDGTTPQLRIDTGLQVYFCDPRARAMRHEREHQRHPPIVLPKDIDLTRHTVEDLAAVAATLNSRPPRHSGGERQPKQSPSIYAPLNQSSLQGPVESALFLRPFLERRSSRSVMLAALASALVVRSCRCRTP